MFIKRSVGTSDTWSNAMDIEGYGEFGGLSEDEDDDIARFERQCAERARAEGALPEEGSDEEEEIKRKRFTAEKPQDIHEWQEKCELLQDKLGRKEGELAQVSLMHEAPRERIWVISMTFQGIFRVGYTKESKDMILLFPASPHIYSSWVFAGVQDEMFPTGMKSSVLP